MESGTLAVLKNLAVRTGGYLVLGYGTRMLARTLPLPAGIDAPSLLGTWLGWATELEFLSGGYTDNQKTPVKLAIVFTPGLRRVRGYSFTMDPKHPETVRQQKLVQVRIQDGYHLVLAFESGPKKDFGAGVLRVDTPNATMSGTGVVSRYDLDEHGHQVVGTVKIQIVLSHHPEFTALDATYFRSLQPRVSPVPVPALR